MGKKRSFSVPHNFVNGCRRNVCGAFRQEKAELSVGWDAEET